MIPVLAVLYAVLSAGAAIFQAGLAVGLPWGSFALGGVHPGRFPPQLRIAAAVQGVILLLLAGIVLARAGFAPFAPRTVGSLIWLVVAVNALSLGLNAVSRSPGERRIWVPVAATMLGCSVAVALATR